jgi:hypothetical protein
VLAEFVVQSNALYAKITFLEEVYQVTFLMIMELVEIFIIGLTKLELKEAPAGSENPKKQKNKEKLFVNSNRNDLPSSPILRRCHRPRLRESQ